MSGSDNLPVIDLPGADRAFTATTFLSGMESIRRFIDFCGPIVYLVLARRICPRSCDPTGSTGRFNPIRLECGNHPLPYLRVSLLNPHTLRQSHQTRRRTSRTHQLHPSHNLVICGEDKGPRLGVIIFKGGSMEPIVQSQRSVPASRQSADRMACVTGSGGWRYMLPCAAALFAASADSKAATFQYTDLNPAGLNSYAYDINNAGQIVGSGDNAAQFIFSKAILWNGTAATYLDPLPDRLFAYARSINDAGRVAGASYVFGPYAYRAVVWNGTTPTQLQIPAGRLDAAATAINNAGQIVGSTDGGYENAVRWNSPTAPIDLSRASGLNVRDNSYARDINDAGQVVGEGFAEGYPGGSADNPRQAILWNGTAATFLGPGTANAINNLGQVVGASAGYPMLWSGGTATVLDTIQGNASDINESGQVVGSRFLSGHSYATLWDGGVATDLNSFLDAGTVEAGWVLTQANAINDNGWIVGTAQNTTTGERHAYLLSPVPEPSAYLLMLLGLSTIGITFRRTRRCGG